MAAALAPTPVGPAGADRRINDAAPPPATPIAKPALLREWSYPPTTPVAVVVDPGPGPPPPPPPQQPAGSPLLALQNAWVQQIGQQSAQYPVVATLVTSLACNLRSGIDHIYAGIAAPVDDDDAVAGAAAAAAAVAASPKSPQNHASAPAPSVRDRLASSGSVEDDWVLDAYEEAEFRVVDGKLVEVSVPVPSIEDDEEYEEALLRHRGRHCIRGPRGADGGGRALRRNVGRVRKWIRRRREAATERRERKNGREPVRKDLRDFLGHHGDDRASPIAGDDPSSVDKATRKNKSVHTSKSKNKRRRGWAGGAAKRDAPMMIPPAPPRPQEQRAKAGVPTAPVAQYICRMGSPLVEPTAQVARLIGQYYYHHAGRYLTAEGFLPAPQDQPLPPAMFGDAIAEKIAKNDALVRGDDKKDGVDGADRSPREESGANEKAAGLTVDELLQDITSALEDDSDDVDDFEDETSTAEHTVDEGRVEREERAPDEEEEDRTDEGSTDIPEEQEHRTVRHRVDEIEAHHSAALPLPLPSNFVAAASENLPALPEGPAEASATRTCSEYVDLDKVEQSAGEDPEEGEGCTGAIETGSVGQGTSANQGPRSTPEHDDSDQTLKVVFVGAPDVDKSSIVDALAGSSSQPRRRSSGVVIRNWDPRLDDELAGSTKDSPASEVRAAAPPRKDVKFSIWDVPSGNPGGVEHFATPSVFFSPNSLYVIVWNMAARNVKTRRRKYSDDFETESSNRKADRALERDIDDKVLSWVDCIRKAGGERSAILPIASCEGDFGSLGGSDEARRRCEVMKRCLLKHYDISRRSSVKPLPELIFDGQGCSNSSADDSSVLRVDATQIEGFASLKGALVDFASGLSNHGHHSATPSVVRTEVKKAIKDLKAQDNKVVHVDVIVSAVKDAVRNENGVDIKNAVMDCLQLLSSTGDVIYYGKNADSFHQSSAVFSDAHEDTATFNKKTRETIGDLLPNFVILSPKFLLSAVSCVLRRDFKQELIETRSFMNSQGMVNTEEQFAEELSCHFLNKHSNCPIVSSKDASMLWQSMAFMRDASDGVLCSSGSLHSPILFEYMKQLLIHRGVFLPIHLCTPSPLLCGERLSLWIDHSEKNTSISSLEGSKVSTFFLIPSLLSPETPQDVWTYKSTESWRTTICHSWLFKDGIHPGMMERLTASVLQDVFNYTSVCSSTFENSTSSNLTLYSMKPSGRNFRVHQVMVWKTAFLFKLGVDVQSSNGEYFESTVEVFGYIVGNCDSRLSVASDFMGSNMKRLVVSAKGRDGDGGRKIWRGGYGLILKSLENALDGRHGHALEREAVCPECLETRRPSMANTWKMDFLRVFARRGQGRVRCAHGHHVDASLLCGFGKPSHQAERDCHAAHLPAVAVKPVGNLLRGVVIVGLWDDHTKQLTNVGSGFIADKDKGLVVTASHILFEMYKEKGFGKEYYGLRHGKAVVGVIPERDQNNEGTATAVFRYFAEIVAHDVCSVDACVLRITTKFELDVGGQGEGCGDQPEIPLLNDLMAMKAEKLQQLKLTKRYELEESVRILGFNQGGEGRLQPGRHINRCADFAKGYICKTFKTPVETGAKVKNNIEKVGHRYLKRQFVPSQEIVVMCPTIDGHSGGPCVNQEGDVIGILSRADRAHKQRCYLVPAKELKRLLKKAKAKCTLSPLELYYIT